MIATEPRYLRAKANITAVNLQIKQWLLVALE